MPEKLREQLLDELGGLVYGAIEGDGSDWNEMDWEQKSKYLQAAEDVFVRIVAIRQLATFIENAMS